MPVPTERGNPGAVVPRKTKNVAPIYPSEAQRDGVQGAHQLLDVAAARAVLEWEFAPESVKRGGKPVIATMTVTFKTQ